MATVHRPLRAVARALATLGVPIAPGTLADAQSRLLGVFEPLEGAIAERQRSARAWCRATRRAG